MTSCFVLPATINAQLTNNVVTLPSSNHILIYYAAVSLDGFIAGKDGDVTWLDGFFIPELGFHDFIKRVGGVIMGRRTFDKIAFFGKWPYGELKGTIATHREMDGSFGPVQATEGAQGIYATANAHRPARTGSSAARTLRRSFWKRGC